MNAEHIERTVITIVSSFDGQLPSEQLLDMRDLAEHAECGIALENLCIQLFEYDIPVAPVVLAQIREVGEAMRISADYWERLTLKGPE